MTFGELCKKASRRPWRICNGFCLETSRHVYIAQFDASETPNHAAADVTLAAHCCNNYGNALEALREAIELCCSENAQKRLQEILLKLETVEEGHLS